MGKSARTTIGQKRGGSSTRKPAPSQKRIGRSLVGWGTEGIEPGLKKKNCLIQEGKKPKTNFDRREAYRGPQGLKRRKCRLGWIGKRWRGSLNERLIFPETDETWDWQGEGPTSSTHGNGGERREIQGRFGGGDRRI